MVAAGTLVAGEWVAGSGREAVEDGAEGASAGIRSLFSSCIRSISGARSPRQNHSTMDSAQMRDHTMVGGTPIRRHRYWQLFGQFQ